MKIHSLCCSQICFYLFIYLRRAVEREKCHVGVHGKWGQLLASVVLYSRSEFKGNFHSVDLQPSLLTMLSYSKWQVFKTFVFVKKKKKKIRLYIIKHWHFTLWSFSHLYVLLYSYRGTEYHDTGLADTQLALLCSHITFKRAALLLNRRAAHNNVSHLLSQYVGKWKNVKAENIF